MVKPCAACGGTGEAIIPYRGGKGFAETLDEAKYKPIATRKVKCQVCKGLQVVSVVEHVPPQRVRFPEPLTPEEG